MSESAEAESPADLKLWAEIQWYWQRWPNKGFWICLFLAWIALFHFLGNATLGYVDSRSLFGWMQYSYSRHPDDEHGYLIPAVIIVMFWWKRRELLARTGDVWFPALSLILLALLIHIVAYRIQQTRISIVAFALGLYGLLGLAWGRRFMVNSFFPMILFAFAIPLSTVSETITYPLRILVAKISWAIGHGVLAMPITLDGSQIRGPDGAFDVAPACSGIRSLTALGAVTMIYSFIGFAVAWQRWLILLVALPLAVAGNVARVTTVILLGDVFGQAFAMRMEQYLGLVTFAVGIGCLLLLGRWLQRRFAS
ncbi:MAG: exosortase/archaeosortase family protein [Verrucomicrobiota bacterium]